MQFPASPLHCRDWEGAQSDAELTANNPGQYILVDSASVLMPLALGPGGMEKLKKQ